MTTAATFEELRWACAAHNRAGRHEQALAAADEAWRRFPEHRDYTWWLVAYTNVALGRLRDAVAALERAEAESRFWRIGMLRSPAMDPLRTEPRFVALLARAEARIAARGFRPRLLVTGPEPPDPSAPLLLGLHGARGRAEDEHERWLPATALGCLVASVQSSQPATEDGFCWDDPDQTRRDLAAVLPQLPAHGDVAMTGFSQGGATALALALAGDVLPARAVLAVGPSFPPAASLPDAGRPLDVVVLHGSDDRLGVGVADVADALRAAGHRVHVELVPGLGHEYPADFAGRLPGLLAAAGVRGS